jgi:uncharacterized protein YfkK (UPF0435 family)
MENQEQAQMPEQAVEAAQQQPQLSINDLQNLRSIVDMAVRRGAFGASEMSAVGAAYDRVNAFLNAVAPQTEQTPAA